MNKVVVVVAAGMVHIVVVEEEVEEEDFLSDKVHESWVMVEVVSSSSWTQLSTYPKNHMKESDQRVTQKQIQQPQL